MNQQGLTKLPSSQLQAPAFGAIPGVDALKMFQSQMQTASGVNTLGMQQAVLQPMAKSSQLPITGTISSVPTATPQPRIQLPFNVQQQQQQPTFIQNPFYSRLAMTNRVGMLQPFNLFHHLFPCLFLIFSSLSSFSVYLFIYLFI